MKTKQIGRIDTSHIIRIALTAWVILIALYTIYINSSFYHDDAYITLRYARNFINGSGIVWNSGEYIQGYTNFLHLILISILCMGGIDLSMASRLIGLASLIGLVVVMLLFCSTYKIKNNEILSFLPAIIVATSTPVLVWSIGGLEGTLFSLLVATGIILFLISMSSSKIRYWHYVSSSIFFSLGFLTRPDGIIFIAVALAFLIWNVVLLKNKSYSCIVSYILGILIVVVPFIFWQLSYYGNILPNTYYAKTGAPLDLRLYKGLKYILSYSLLPPYLPIIILLSSAYSISKRLWSLQQGYLSLSIISYILFIILVGGDHMPSFRLLLPVIPIMGLILFINISMYSKYNNWMIIFLMVLTTLQIHHSALNPRNEDPASFVGTVVGKYIESNWPRGSLVALNTAGSTPYFGKSHQYIDMLGLNDAVIAKRKIVKLELPWQYQPGHLKGDGNYVLSRQPDFIIIGPAEGTLASNPWFLSDLELIRNKDFFHYYILNQVRLDINGRPVVHCGLLFTYYRRKM